MSSLMLAARWMTVSRCKGPSGWGMDTGWKLGRPKARDWARAELVKGAVHITMVGMPRFSKVIASCTLHAVQDPQSAMAVTTKSHLSLRASTTSSAAGRE